MTRTKTSIKRRNRFSRLEQLEDRRMLAFSAPSILISDDAGHLNTATEAFAAGYKAIMTQSTGKIVVAGTAHGSKDDDFYLARYMADGSGDFVLDPTFGDNGTVLTNFLTSKQKRELHPDVLYGAAIDSQDRIVAVGELPFAVDDVIVRYTSDGQLDTSFSDDGWDSPGDLIQTLTRQVDWSIAFDSNDGPIVAAVGGAQSDLRMYRYNAAGNFDADFGVVSTTVRDGFFGERYGRQRVVDIDVYHSSDPLLDGKIVLAGWTVGDVYDPAVDTEITRRDWTVLRFETDGSLDTTFGDEGIAVQRVYIPGPDPRTFEDGSAAQTSHAQGILLEPDGRIVASGFTAEGMTITRYNTDGSYDTTFNPTGIQPGRSGVYIPALGHVDHNDGIAGEFGTNITKDAEGNYIVGGTWVYRGAEENDTSGLLDRFAFAKFQPDGSLDTNFGDNGTYLSYVGAGGNRMSGLVVNNRGEIWAAGYDADRKSILLRFAEQSDNQVPVAIDDAYATDEDTLLTIAAPGVLSNDSDGDGDSLSVVAFDAVSSEGAAVSANGSGGFSYDPRSATSLQSLSSGELLQDSFTYTISDGRGGTATATVHVAVQGLEEPPTSDTPLLINDIRFESKRGNRDWRAVVEIRDIYGNAVAGVSLKVDFAGTTYNITTDSSGIARTNWERNLSGTYYYADAYDLALTGYSWSPFSFDLEDDSDADGKPDDVLNL